MFILHACSITADWEESMTDRIEVFKQNHIKVTSANGIVHIDPFMVDRAMNDADYILITHDHHDHFSIADIGKTTGRNTILVVPENMKDKAAEAGNLVAKIVTVRPGESCNVDGLEFETIASYNIGKPFHPKEAGWVGYILKTDGKRIYIAGDTDATDEAKAVKCDIALVPAGGKFTMDAREAAELVNTIRPEVAIPVHYGGIVGTPEDGKTFEKLVADGIKVDLYI